MTLYEIKFVDGEFEDGNVQASEIEIIEETKYYYKVKYNKIIQKNYIDVLMFDGSNTGNWKGYVVYSFDIKEGIHIFKSLVRMRNYRRYQCDLKRYNYINKMLGNEMFD